MKRLKKFFSSMSPEPAVDIVTLRHELFPQPQNMSKAEIDNRLKDVVTFSTLFASTQQRHFVSNAVAQLPKAERETIIFTASTAKLAAENFWVLGDEHMDTFTLDCLQPPQSNPPHKRSPLAQFLSYPPVRECCAILLSNPAADRLRS